MYVYTNFINICSIISTIVFACGLFVFGQVNAFINYYRNTQYLDFGHWQLNLNTISFIRTFRMTKYNIYWIVIDIIISIAHVSWSDAFNEFGITFLHLCVSLMYVDVFVHFKWIYAVIQHSGCCMSFNNVLEYSVMIVPFLSI